MMTSLIDAVHELTALASPLTFGVFSLFCSGVSHERMSRLVLLASALLLLFCSSPITSHLILVSLENRPGGNLDSTPTAPVAVVLGGGLAYGNGRSGPADIWPHSDRLCLAFELYRLGKSSLILISGGSGPGSTPDSLLSASVLRAWSVAPSTRLTGELSRDTYENAVFATFRRTALHALNPLQNPRESLPQSSHLPYLSLTLLIHIPNKINLTNPLRPHTISMEDPPTMNNRVWIFDTTLRDGEQSPGCSMTVPEKLRMAAKLVELGVDILEAGFPIASQGDFEAVDAVSREFPWAHVAALARCTKLDIERAASSLTKARRPRIHTFMATSDIHLKYKFRKSREQVLSDIVSAIELARSYVDDVEFSAEDGARTDPDYLEQVARAAVAAGARTINIPDTVGYSTPEEYGDLIGRIVNALGDTAVVSVHCHDDLGLAVANSLAAVNAGARQIECTVNGIGERAGNCSLEEVVMVMKTRHDRYPYTTGIHTEHLYSASQLLTSLISFGPQPNKAIVGRNAFAHEAGIHQDGYLKERTTYEIIDPKSVGVPEGKLVLGKHSGRHALKNRCEDLGFHLTKEELDVVYIEITRLADNKKGLMDEEIAELARRSQQVGQALPPVEVTA